MAFSIAHSPLEIFYVSGAFAFALLIGTIAETKIIENPIIYDVLHGVWHIFTAIGIYYLITL